MKRSILYLLSTLYSLCSFSQKDSMYEIEFIVKSQKLPFSFQKISDEKDLKVIGKIDYPIYLFDDKNFKSIKLTALMVQKLDKELIKYINKNSIIDSLDNEYNNLLSSQEKRILLYKNSYDQLKTINEELSKQLDLAIDIGRKSGKWEKRNGVIYGILGGLATGIIIGVALTR